MPRLPRPLAAALAVLLAAPAGAAAPPPPAPAAVASPRTAPGAYLLELEGPASVHAYVAALGDRSPVARAAAARAAAAQAADNRDRQRALVAALPAAAPGARVLYQVQKVLNAVAVVAAPADAAALRALPGVVAVRPLVAEVPHNAYSVPFIGAPTTWSGPGGPGTAFRGEGMRIGIIDTGIDYLHAQFGGANASAPFYFGEAGATSSFVSITFASFPSAKIAGGYDFAGDSYDASVAGSLPAPDPNPMDCNGHGTHVAGTAAGRGVTASGQPYAGPWDATVPFESLRIGPGVAPAATLYALKVFGCTGSTNLTVQAIEWAVDPNNDDDPADRLDVINLSLGSPYGRLSDTTAMAADAAALAGVVVVASAGNSGDVYTVSGSPGSGERVITVANATSYAKAPQLEVTAPAVIAGVKRSLYAAFSNTDFPPAMPIAGTLAKVSNTDLGCSAYGGTVFIGKVALVQRGSCNFDVKHNNAVNAGAIGVVVVNNSAGPLTLMGGAPVNPAVPALMIGDADGAAIRARMDAGDAVIVATAVAESALGDGLNASSSRGPAGAGELVLLKPDLAAPGTNIRSAGSGRTCLAGCYRPDSPSATLSGTSMAAPHVAGMMALLRQAHPTLGVAELKALAMNNAIRDVWTQDGGTGLRHAPGRIGAGRIEVPKAIGAQFSAASTDDPGAVSVTFQGEVPAQGTLAQTQTVTVRNRTSAEVTYALALDVVTAVPGVAFSLPASLHVTVPANGVASFPVGLAATAGAMKRARDATVPPVQGANPRQWMTEASGFVTLRPTNTKNVIRVPVYAALRPNAAMRHTPVVETGGAATGTSAIVLSGVGVCTGALAGASCTTSPGSPTPSDPVVDFASLVSAFELHAVKTAPNPAQEAGAALQYAGVLHDATADRLYFGVSTFGDRLHPVDTGVQSILVDTDGNGSDDYQIYAGVLTGSQDVLVSVVQPLPAGSAAVGDWLNAAPAHLADTNVHRSNLVVLPVSPAQLGVSASSPTFRYKVRSCDDLNVCETLGPFVYAGRGFELPGVLRQDQPGAAIPVGWNLATIAQNGSKGVLVFHHHNAEGQRAGVAVLDAMLAVTSTTLVSSAPTVAAGASVTLTASVTGAAPTGTVAFRDGAAVVPGCAAVPLAGTGNTRTAQCTASALPVGAIPFVASYAGDAFNRTSAGSTVQTVNAIGGQACGPFTDVDAGSAFCRNVEWMRNRAITSGCSATAYCPTQPVTRLQMARFLSNAGGALAPEGFSVSTVSGPLDLDAGVVVCDTQDWSLTSTFGRSLQLRAAVSATAAAPTDFAVALVESGDMGATWAPLGSAVRASVAANRWVSVPLVGSVDLAAGTSVTYAVRVSREGLAGTADLAALRCHLRGVLGNRNAPFSPFDP